MFKKILVALDPARDLQPARQYALDLVSKWGSSVVALYTVFEEAAPFRASNAVGVKPKTFVGNKVVEGFENQIKKECEGKVQCSTFVEEGPYEVTIPAVAAREGVDLVVLGSFHTRTERRFVGSDIERVIEYSPCSVMVVRNPSRVPEPGTLVVFAHDNAILSAEPVHWLTEFAKAAGTVVQPVIGVPPRDLDAGKKLADGLEKELVTSGIESVPPQVLTSRWILGPHGVVHRAVSGLHPSMTVIARLNDVVQGNASHWLIHEFIADTPCPTLVLK